MHGENYAQVLVAEVASTLTRANIGCLLWGEFVLRAYGSTIPAKHIEFLVEDADTRVACATLRRAGYIDCPDRPCHHFARHHPRPANHFLFATSRGAPLNGITIGITNKTALLPSYPDLNATVNAIPNNNNFFMFAADACLPEPGVINGGRHDPSLPSVVMPRPAKFVDALVKLYEALPNATYPLWLQMMADECKGAVDVLKMDVSVERRWRELCGLGRQ